jgi:hypothetical protein
MAYTIARVARGYGERFQDVADWPWSDVLRSAMALDELERVDAVQRDMETLELAIRIATGMSQPRDLIGLRRDVESRMRLSALLADEAQRAKETLDMAMIARAERIARRNRRQ